MPSLQVRAVQIIDAPVSLVWEIVADLDAYHRHVGSLAESTVVEGAGEGAQRRCVDTAGSTWTETCTDSMGPGAPLRDRGGRIELSAQVPRPLQGL